VVTHVNMNELRRRWGQLVAGVREENQVVILLFHGRPSVALISYAEYTRCLHLLEPQPPAADNPP
jgi:prevent-host-death family protein